MYTDNFRVIMLMIIHVKKIKVKKVWDTLRMYTDNFRVIMLMIIHVKKIKVKNSSINS